MQWIIDNWGGSEIQLIWHEQYEGNNNNNNKNMNNKE